MADRKPGQKKNRARKKKASRFIRDIQKLHEETKGREVKPRTLDQRKQRKLRRIRT